VFTPAKRLKELQQADPSTLLGIRLRPSAALTRRKTVQLNKTFCYLFTQTACLFEMIIRTYLS